MWYRQRRYRPKSSACGERGQHEKEIVSGKLVRDAARSATSNHHSKSQWSCSWQTHQSALRSVQQAKPRHAILPGLSACLLQPTCCSPTSVSWPLWQPPSYLSSTCIKSPQKGSKCRQQGCGPSATCKTMQPLQSPCDSGSAPTPLSSSAAHPAPASGHRHWGAAAAHPLLAPTPEPPAGTCERGSAQVGLCNDEWHRPTTARNGKKLHPHVLAATPAAAPCLLRIVVDVAATPTLPSNGSTDPLPQTSQAGFQSRQYRRASGVRAPCLHKVSTAGAPAGQRDLTD